MAQPGILCLCFLSSKAQIPYSAYRSLQSLYHHVLQFCRVHQSMAQHIKAGTKCVFIFKTTVLRITAYVLGLIYSNLTLCENSV